MEPQTRQEAPTNQVSITRQLCERWSVQCTWACVYVERDIRSKPVVWQLQLMDCSCASRTCQDHAPRKLQQSCCARLRQLVVSSSRLADTASQLVWRPVPSPCHHDRSIVQARSRPNLVADPRPIRQHVLAQLPSFFRFQLHILTCNRV